MKIRFLLCALLAASARLGFSQGIIIRPDFYPAPLELRRHVVNAEVHEQIAVVTVEHEFYNPGAATVEGIFLFPLPANAQVSRFAMHAEGKEMVGELLTADEARKIYEDIVRKNLDPALLEMADYRTFRASIFPIPPRTTRRLMLRYDATLPREVNTVTFQFPMQGSLTQRGAGRPMPLPMPPEFQPMKPRAEQERSQKPEHMPSQQSLVRLELHSETGLKNIYSPSHRVDIRQTSDHRATVEFETNNALEGREFLLYYSRDPNEIGAALFAHRPVSDKPGYFILLLSPPVEVGKRQVLAKDLVLVLDTSGSMAGEKMKQAKAALRYCLQRLGERDRFGLVTFSSEAKSFRPELAALKARDDALWHIDRLEATGGTNINEALLAAAGLLRDSPSGQGMIIFVTDGLPTSGVTDEGKIRRNLQEVLTNEVRVFSFGVGYDVNTRLLDGLSKANRAFADYILPEENLEARVSTFYEKVRYPVMSNLDFEFRGADVRSFSPARLPDLFKGGQVILTGRYYAPGRTTLVLRGQAGERRQSFQYDFDLPGRERDRDFVARLWATRRVGDLLEEIRLNGEHEELKNEVIALAKEFGLVTPYTSYLVQEEERYTDAVPHDIGIMQPSVSSREREATQMMSIQSGAEAVRMSKSIREMQSAEVALSSEQSGFIAAQGRLLQFKKGSWVDSEYQAGAETVKLAFASEAYFMFLRLYPEAREFCKLGQMVIFKFRSKFVEIGAEGEKQMSESKMRALLE